MAMLREELKKTYSECHENSWTSTIITKLEKINSLLTVITEKIALTQQPKENLYLDLVIWYDPDHQQQQFDRYIYKMSLVFENELHTVSRDYGYEIILKLRVAEKDGKCHHVHLFSHYSMRESYVIKFKDERFCISKSHTIKHICCHIRRFKVNGRRSARDSSANVDCSVGMMLLKSGYYSDVTLLVGDKTFPVHTYVLSSKSNTFKDIFEYSMKQNISEVKIEHIDANVMDEMLHYIYTGKTSDLKDIAFKLYKAAKQYKIDDLMSKCEEYFMFILKYENADDMLEIARRNNLTLEDGVNSFIRNCIRLDTLARTLKLCEQQKIKDLKLVAFEFIVNHDKDVFDDEEFLYLFHSHPRLMTEIFIYVQKTVLPQI